MVPHSSEEITDAKANAERIEAEIETLQAHLRGTTGGLGNFWSHVKEINGLFKSLRPLWAEDRRRLWAKLDGVCVEAKERQAENKKNWEKRQSVSANKRSLVESKIREAYFQAKGGSSASELAKAGELLKTALEWMKNGWSGFTPTTQLFALDDGRMTKTDHDACWERWREANEMLQSRRRELSDNNFSHFRGEAEEAIGTADYDPKSAKEKIQAIQKSMQGRMMNGEQYSEVRRLLDKAWEHATHKQKRHHEESVKRRDEWVDRQQGHIQRKRELISQSEDVIDRIEGQIEHCRDLEANARTDDYRDTVRGWIEEKYDVIAAKRRFIAELEEQIREIEDKLRR